ncbi:MAG: tRNA (guanosine(37)-N1)-methyltransferase TrmD [Thermodesulfobacteriota bacterium]|nr:tRNA (guanosine(37)-N1)-methyltransferase TrmD [Thermodesulfobacteriota bacterium]
MNFIALTIFPEMFRLFSDHGIIRKAIEEKKIRVSAINIRDFALDKHHVTDDRPYGGGCGMLMKPEPVAGAIRAAKKEVPSAKTILLTPAGRVFDHQLANEFKCYSGLILVCGRYEGMDERICQEFIDHEVSLGDYVLTGGELAAMVLIDAVTRLIPGILGGSDSAAKDSFSGGLLEHAQYTRPRNFEGEEVPEVLLSGHHREIEKWRMETSLIRTFLKRKDLLQKRPLDNGEIEILQKWCQDIEKIINLNQGGHEKPKS